MVGNSIWNDDDFLSLDIVVTGFYETIFIDFGKLSFRIQFLFGQVLVRGYTVAHGARVVKRFQPIKCFGNSRFRPAHSE